MQQLRDSELKLLLFDVVTKWHNLALWQLFFSFLHANVTFYFYMCIKKPQTNKYTSCNGDPNADNVSWASSFQDMGPGRMGHWDIQLLLLLFL